MVPYIVNFPLCLEGYNDANWISNSDEIKSTSSYVFTLKGSVVAWKSSKQTLIATYTMESKLIALESPGKEAEWLRNFLSGIHLGMQPTPSVSMHCDCQAAISIAKNKAFYEKSRHIRLRHEIVKQLLIDESISIDYVKSKVNLVDYLTKPLGRKLILETSNRLRLKPIRD